MNAFCVVHPERAATQWLNVPCARDGKLGVCDECAKPEHRGAVFRAYQSAHGRNIRDHRNRASGKSGLN